MRVLFHENGLKGLGKGTERQTGAQRRKLSRVAKRHFKISVSVINTRILWFISRPYSPKKPVLSDQYIRHDLHVGLIHVWVGKQHYAFEFHVLHYSLKVSETKPLPHFLSHVKDF